MAGGYGNIRPEDGKQFSKEYQPKEKWTEEKSLKLGNELLEWLTDKTDKDKESKNIFFEQFIVVERKLPVNLVAYLSKKFTSFCELIDRAKKIQELKLVRFGIFDKTNPTMTKFVLTNHHNYSDKKETTLKGGLSLGKKFEKKYTDD